MKHHGYGIPAELHIAFDPAAARLNGRTDGRFRILRVVAAPAAMRHDLNHKGTLTGSVLPGGLWAVRQNHVRNRLVS